MNTSMNNKVNDVYINSKLLYFTRIECTNLLLFQEFAMKPRYTYKLSWHEQIYENSCTSHSKTSNRKQYSMQDKNSDKYL